MKEKRNVRKIRLVIGNNQHVPVRQLLKNIGTLNACFIFEIKPKVNHRTKKTNRRFFDEDVLVKNITFKKRQGGEFSILYKDTKT